MNFTLKQLQQRVNNLIEEQGEDAHCAAWIYTKEDCFLTDDNGEQEYPCDKHPELAERIFNDIGNNDYIYQVIQESVCLLYTSPSPRDAHESRMPSSA